MKRLVVQYSILLILCLVLPGIIPSNGVLMFAIMAWSCALIYLVYRVLKEPTNENSNSNDQYLQP